MTSDYIQEKLNIMIPNPKVELNYNKDYELLMAVILSAQATDISVNKVTPNLFKYNLEEISNLNLNELETIIKSIGTYKRKATYIKEVAKRLLNDYKGLVPENREYLESLPGVGRKTANVVLSNLFDHPAIAVDTHVERVSKRLEIASPKDDVLKVEKKLNKFFPKEDWTKMHHQLVLFGRYICKARKPDCYKCLFQNECKYAIISKVK